MKAGFVAAALVAGAAAAHHRQAHHAALFKRGTEMETCIPGCTTIYTTITGEAAVWTPTTTVTPATTWPVTVPTPVVETCPTPGVYTFPAKTVTVTDTTTVCAASTTKCPKGTHTLGGVTTVVVSETTVTCPYATVKTDTEGVVTSTIDMTTYVCPSAGTYTIAPITTTVTDTETVVVVPVVTTYCPGTYTKPEVVTTVTETDTIVVCPFATPTESAPATAWPTETSSPAPVGGTLCTGSHITYTGYQNDAAGGCKSESQVFSDIQDLKSRGFCSVRIYSTDCNQLEYVGNACRQLGLKMIIGVFVKSPGCDATISYIAEQITDIVAWLPANLDLVSLVVAGNEVLNNGYCSAPALAGLIGAVKSAVRGAGYTGPCSTTDTVNQWQNPAVPAAICEVIDIVGYNAYPMFNAQCTPENAGDFIYSQFQIMDVICGSKKVINLESGWSNLPGFCVGSACGSPGNQATAISSMRDAVSKYGLELVFSSDHNDLWKGGDEVGWGCADLFPVL